jgi:hypothetical protein
MAEKKQMTSVYLHDAQGAHVGDAQFETPEDGARPDLLHHDGKYYVWNQRNAQYRAVEAVKSGGKADQAQLAPAQAAESKEAK